MVRRETVAREGVALEEVVELRDKLEEVTESKETAIDGPRRPGRRVGVIVSAEEDNTLVDSFLSRVGVCVNALDRGLRDTVEEAEAVLCY